MVMTIGQVETLKLINHDNSKIMECQKKIQGISNEMENSLCELYRHAVDYEKFKGLWISVKDYLDIQTQFYKFVNEYRNLYQKLDVWNNNTKTLLEREK